VPLNSNMAHILVSKNDSLASSFSKNSFNKNGPKSMA